MMPFHRFRPANAPRTTHLFFAALLAGAMATALPSRALAAMVQEPGCSANVLPRNDDGYTQAALGFGIFFGGAFHTHTYVDNNGYVMFGAVPPASFAAAGGVPTVDLPTTTRTLIAPFMGDIDTRPLGSDEVTYGPITWNGHTAFCVTWGGSNGVAFYNMKDQLLNKLQLILVSRPDTGAGDFDIIMNYDQIQWDREVARSVNSFPYSAWPTGVGYVPGNRFAVPGASELPGLLLDGQTNSLRAGATRSAVPGRYVFPVRGGLPPSMAVVTGTIYAPGGTPLPGATVQLCRGDGSCLFDVTDAQGKYDLQVLSASLDGAPFKLFASAPAGSHWIFPGAPVDVTPVADAVLGGYDVIFQEPAVPPASVLVVPSYKNKAGTPTVFWKDPLHLVANGCPGGVATYTIYEGQSSTSGAVIATGPMFESAATPGVYSVDVGALQPVHGWTTVVMQIDCPDGNTDFTTFNLYIDPSGHVKNPSGQPIEGAVVTLYRAEHPAGPFEVVPDGSAIMSPANRQNPMLSDDRGHFGWDTIAGYYVVRAEKPGCTAVGDAAQPYAETDVLPVPPPVTDLDLRLDCSAVPPPMLDVPPALSVEAQSPAGAVVSYDASALDATDGPIPVTCLPDTGSLFPLGTTVVTCSATSSYGNVATATFPVTVTAPAAPTCVTIRHGVYGEMADAFLSGDYPTWAAGLDYGLWIGESSGGNTNYALLRFELDVLPPGVQITSAELGVHVAWNMDDTVVSVHQVLVPWNEAMVTHSSFVDGSSWSAQPGATFLAGDVGLKTADVTSLVAAWVSGAAPNHGILLQEPPVASHVFYSKESSDAQIRPSLDVCYTY